MEIKLIILCGHHIFGISIKCFWLQEDNRILVSYTRQQQSFGLNGSRRTNHFQSRRMCKIRLRRLAVIMGAVTHRPTWRPYCQSPTVKLISCPISELSRFVYYLVKPRKYIVSKLNLGYCSLTYACLKYFKILKFYVKLFLIKIKKKIILTL